MRPGCFRPKDRLADMDIAGIEASACFPNTLVRFCGQRFLHGKDKDLALLCVQAYNDWVVEEWCGSHPDRLIPCQLPFLADPELAAELGVAETVVEELKEPAAETAAPATVACTLARCRLPAAVKALVMISRGLKPTASTSRALTNKQAREARPPAEIAPNGVRKYIVSTIRR